MAKEFPIQNVSFRGEIDRFLTEGGGLKIYQNGLMTLLFLPMQKEFIGN